jgi:peptidoglycan hydrolase-like protein with peptidoglycan-binding domain
MDPQPRTLRLVSPLMHGPNVAEVQRLLGVDADGAFGPITAGAVAAWKRARGEQIPQSDLTPAEHQRMLADVPLQAVRLMERWAAAGVAEDPPRSNRVPELIVLAERQDVAPAYSGMGYPWCAFAAFLAALVAGGTAAANGLRERLFNPLYTPTILAEARKAAFGLRIVAAAAAFRGDLVLFDWNFDAGDPVDHVGRLVRAPADGRVQTVDGNSGNGGRVEVRDRAIGSVRAFARDS